jgi:phosphoglycolate phosphatase
MSNKELKDIFIGIFDVAGTTVSDDGLVIEAFLDAVEAVKPTAIEEQEYLEIVKATMGERKIDVFKRIYISNDEAEKAHSRFIESYLRRVERGEIAAMPGVETVFRELRSRNVRVALNTGFPREILDKVITVLGWQGLVDFSVASSEVAQGRPAPDMINSIIEKFNSRSAQRIGAENSVVLGDTVADMSAAKAAGVKLAIGVFSGIHSKNQLIDAGADTVIDSIFDSLPYFPR